ncbi:hypothetical protein AAE02nite_27440 [Adhaeribacter aerolatus]|uniref:Uncharacterized protein n=1 Tax=Adhaeribacter aerolatus TaxID=670289 RepID=A0A512AZF0_9BACT|nr:hypothetical protein [Adhaeribacter aerolatus]GEO05080.1 hypothetical protein AAE02nite_27440 [Adhaeribacter aerolatus]
MNRTVFVFFIGVFLAFSGCKQIDKLLTFNINRSQTITVPKEAVIPNLGVLGPPVVISADTKEEFRRQNTAAELVKDVVVTKIVMNVESPANEDFGFLKEVELLLAADNLPEVSIAYLKNIPADAGKTLELTSNNVKLDKYIKAPSITLRTRGTADEVVLNDVTVKVDITFRVTADPL